MTITIYGNVYNGYIYGTDTVYSKLYDPTGLLAKYEGQDDLVVTIKLFVSKSNKLVALVDNITRKEKSKWTE